MCDKVLFLPQTVNVLGWIDLPHTLCLSLHSSFSGILSLITESIQGPLDYYQSLCSNFSSKYFIIIFNHMYLVPFLVPWKLHNNRNYVYLPYFCLFVFCLVGISIHLESLYSWLKNFLILPFPYCLSLIAFPLHCLYFCL